MAQPLTLFYNNGKTFIGGLVDSSTLENNSKELGNIPTGNDYYVISSPCEIELNLENEEGTSSQIKFKRIMPLCPIKMSSKSGDLIYFSFSKQETVLSNITSSSLKDSVIKAYKTMTGVTTV